MKRYVIHKSTRHENNRSYSGSTWDRAGLRDLYKEYYDDLREAKFMAKLLGTYNPVGFVVRRVRGKDAE